MFDDTKIAKQITAFWDDGEELKGWTHYWHYLYDAIIRLTQKSTEFEQAILLVKYEDLCNKPSEILSHIFTHCELADKYATKINAKYTDLLSPPDYYSLPFSPDEKDAIMSITKTISMKFNYTIDNHL